ncbi:polycystin-1 [Myxocyprinus asiaticus]|uniref:polycystin-1 n=1 Tax=Myxocyprinus asiaticus TaxID=70543 RepID=UPI0022228E45|nr:polycystin-1 [Myxocyprinus asiaticus]
MANILHLPFIWILCVFTSCFSEYCCPKGAKIDRDGLHCYWMPTFTSTWLETRDICQRDDGGDLAVVNSVTVQTFIQNSFQLEAPVLVWLRNVMTPGPSDDLDTETFQHEAREIKSCTSMALASGHWMNEQCDKRNSIICEKKISVSLPSLESFMTGVPLMSGIYTVSQMQLLPSPPDPGHQRVEVILFPGLWFSHEGRVLSLDLVTQPSVQLTFARVQIFRPYCSPSHHLVPPGCSYLLNPFSCCSLIPMCNTTGGCASGQYWCHLLEICLPVTSPCSPYHSFNLGHPFSLPPRYPATPPFFHLMADMSLKLPPTADYTHISVTIQDKDITVYPDDILAVQHTRRTGEFLHCVAGTSSAWRHSYLSLHGPEWGGWFKGSLTAHPGVGQWLDGVVCDLRVIYEDTNPHYGVSPIPSTMQTTSESNSPIKTQSLVTSLHVLYPELDKNNQMHVAINVPTLIVIKINSGENAISSWSAPVSKNGVLFVSSCPAVMLEIDGGCVRETSDTWFSYVYMVLPSQGEHTLNIVASNSLNSQSLSLRVVSHIPVTGLSIQPLGFSRVLVDIPQLFTASVATGSSVTYTWVIDDLVQFEHTGESYSLAFKKPAEYTLKVMAKNPVSSQLIEVKLTADVMTPLAELAVISMPEAIAVNTSTLYTIHVKADISIGVTIRWDFGDNTTSVSHPISAALEIKDSYLQQSIKHVYLQDSTHHMFSFPGDYTLKIMAYNKYDHIEKTVTVKVRTPISRLLVSSSPVVCQVNHTIFFEVLLWPSSYGVIYSWNFGDNSSKVKEYHSKISHVFIRPRKYDVTICANNTVSVLTNYTAVEVVEAVSGLQLSYIGSIELNCIFEITGNVSAGTHLKWTFDFGDGSILKDHFGSSASHIYMSPGNYTVQVTAYNSVNRENQSVNVEVYKLFVSKILPTDCIVNEAEIDFEVLVKGNVPLLTFHWDFGDGSQLSIVKGATTITHTFLNSGIYSVSVKANSPVGAAHYQTNICVEPQITNVTLHLPKTAVAVNEEICINVSVLPKVSDPYKFRWSNNFSNDTPVIGLSHHCFVFPAEGLYEIMVMASNEVSNKTTKTTVFVQTSVSNLYIKHEGNQDAMAVNQSYYFWAELSGKRDVSFQWDFGDGFLKMKGQNQSHIFAFPGRFCVTVTASNAVSSHSVSIEVEVHVPLSYLMVNTSQPFAEAGKEILFKAWTDVNENVKFNWTLNYLSLSIPGTSEFMYVFPKAGVFLIKVTAQNRVSLMETTMYIEVMERIEGVRIQSQGLQSARYFLTNQIVLLRTSVTHGSNLTYKWLADQSGNNQTISNSEQFQLFTNISGDLYIRLEVSNVLGSVDTELSLRAVECISGVSILASMNVATKGKPVKISVSVASGTDLQYSWFLDSEHSSKISDVPFILHVFKVIGVVELSVSVSNVFGSNNATKLLIIQESISEVDFQINGKSSPFFVASNSILSLHGCARTGNVLHWEWTLTFHNSSVILLADNQIVSYSFVDVGDHHVSLNASNDISWQTVWYIVTIEDTIQGLSLTASSSIVCENDSVTFKPSVSQGSQVSFSLEFMNNISSVDIEYNFTTSSLSVGKHLVRAIAKNNVSIQTVTVTVQVVERMKGLHLIGCCSAVLEASKTISFQANESSSSQADYHWTFLLNGIYSSREIGQKVHFTPITNGSLYVTVEADNGFCSQSLSITAKVQKHVKEVKLVSSHNVAFIDYPITFVAITDGGSDLKLIWDFGDPSGETLVTESNTQDHRYNVTGRFVVQLTALNDISQVSTRMPVEVQKLECAQPSIYLVEEKSKTLKSRPRFFEARVDFKGCITYKASYLWEIFRGPDCSAMDKISLNDSVDVTTPLLSLPRHTLKVGNYCLAFTTRLQGTPLKQHKTLKIAVVHSQLVPLIKGGSHRLWSSKNDLIMDATDSYDPDSEENDFESFQFQWGYITENTAASFSAIYTPHHNIPGNGSILLLPRSTLLPDRVYHFTLTLYKSGRQPVSVSQSVTVYNVALLPVTVNCVSCNSLLSFHVSHSRRIALAGYCSSCEEDTVQYKWTAENQKGEAVALNEVTTSTGNLWREIVIRAGVLMEGHEYTFTLNVTEPASGNWGSASITLVPNHPPYGGICTLSPDDSLHFLETVVIFNCSGWMDDDGDSAQLIFSLQVAQCEDFGPLCPLITLYRGTQSTFGSLVPLGNLSIAENTSVIYVLVMVEDNMGASVIALRKNLTVLLNDHHTTEWLRNKIQSEFWALLQQGNPQNIIQYSIALTSQLNQLETFSAQELEDKIQMRGNVTQALASMPVSTLQDVAQISSALAQSTAAPSEVQCKGCQAKVLMVTEKMIKVIREQTGQSDINPTDTGRNILNVLSSALTVDHIERSNSGHKHLGTSETAVSALGQIVELMRSLMLSQMRGEEALSLAAPKISVVGVRGDPTKDILCTDPFNHCQFHIPSALSTHLKEKRQEVLQILLQMEAEENPFIPAAEPPISTMLAAMEFATPQGKPIPIANLTPDTAIQFTLQKKIREEDESLLRKHFTLSSKGSVNFTVQAVQTNPQAGLYVSLNFSVIPGTGETASGLVRISVGDHSVHSLSQHTHTEKLRVSLSAETPSLEHTIFLTPLLNGSAKDLFVSLNSHVRGVDVTVSVCVFSILCQFFNLKESRWSSEGLSSLSGSRPHTAHCLTQHLTMFGASLFIHPEAVLLLPPSEEPVRNMLVGIVCGVLLLIHLLVGVIAHKLDHLESLRLCCVPLCGQKGRYKYRVLVKTGWKGGSGTTAHVGISLYGLNKSGSRHLQREGAFLRNSLDDFQIETDANLGEIWKIRIWHDNTGLDPSWYLQHVIIWDIQTDNMFFFLVEDWLSVENEKNSGRVEKVVLASCPQELQQFKRILCAQLLFGLREHHLWISLWERPAHSRFSRAQRVTCCALLLHLYLAAGTVWYGAVGRKGSRGPVSTQMLMNAETILVGMTVAALIFPLQTILRFLFQKTKSKVTLDVSLPPSPVSHSVEMDVFLSHPNLSYSSFLSLPTGPDSSIYDGPSPFTNSLQSKKLDLEFWNSTERVDHWPSYDSIFGVPELTGTTHLLKRKKALLQLHLSSTSDHDTLKPTDSPEEDLRTISADLEPTNTLSSGPAASDSGHFTPNESTLSDISCSEWSDLSVDSLAYEPGLHKSPSTLSVLSEASTFLPSLPPDSISTNSNTRIGVVRGVTGLRLPFWVLRVVYLLVAVLLGTCLALVVLYGSRFSSSVVLMWLVSTLSAFLTSALLLEPFAICVQALYLAAVVRPVDPEVEEHLSQETEVRRTGEDEEDKVHPPCGYGLLQAREEARKLRTLRALMRSCLVYMLFLWMVLMVNYQETVQEANCRLLRSAIKHTLISASHGQPSLTALPGWMNAEQWIDQRLISHLYENPSLSLIGPPRLQKVYSQDFCSENFRDQFQSGRYPLMLTAHILSHASPGHQRSSAPSKNTPALLTQPWSKGTSCTFGQREEVVLGNNSESTRQILSDLQTANWMTTGTQAVLIEFTLYHKETSVLAPVSLLLDQTQTGRILAFISIQPFHISPFSGPDLHITLTVLLLLFALCFLSAEVWALIRKTSLYLKQAWCWFQPLSATLTLAAAVLRLYFLSSAKACLSRHRSQPTAFADFHSVATLARTSSQLSAVLLTLLVLKMVGILRFVRRWLVLGRVIRQVFPQICGVAFLLLVLWLLFSHTGFMLFSSSVKGFRTLGQASQSLLCLLRGHMGLHRLCEHHPVVGTLYCLAAVGIGLWVLWRLCAAVLIQTYRIVQADIYRPSMEPQDYEMVQLLIKRLKLWMGLSKTKEFRHRVKFEGMAPPPSRSSQGSQASNPSVPLSPMGSRQTSSVSSLASDSSISESFDFDHYVDRLVPCVDNLLAGFDRVNQLTEEVYSFELQLQEVKSRISQIRKLQRPQKVSYQGSAPTPKQPQLPRHQSTCLLECKPTPFPLQGITNTLPRCRATHSESSILGSGALYNERILSTLDRGVNSANPGNGGISRRRAWNSVTCHSADTAQRLAGSQSTVALPERPQSEDGDREHVHDGMPVKRQAW